MSQSLQIVLFDGSLRPPTFIYRLAEGLSERHTIYIAGFSGSPRTSKKGIQYINCGTATRPLSLIGLSFIWGLKALFRTGSISKFFKTLALIASRNKKALQQHNLDIAIEIIKPNILHLQWPSLLPWCESFLTNKEIAVVLSQRGYQNNVRPMVNRENMDYLKKWYPKIDGFHSVSNAMAAVGDQIFSDPDKINRVVYSGLPTKSFTVPTVRTKNKSLQLLSVGRPHWKKGYAIALSAIKKVCAQDIDCHYTIVGAENNEELLYLINALQLKSIITLTDKLPQQEVYQRMRDADVFVLPSVEEGIANVVIEAMFLGVPVISTDCGGMQELITDNETGWIVPANDYDALANAIEAFNSFNSEKISSIVDAAYHEVVKQHSLQNMIDGMEVLYHQVLIDK